MTTLGVFDSGIGGLSVLRNLQALLPTIPCVYLADNAFAPYGERDVATIETRSLQVTEYLHRHHQIKALVIACNTATAHAIDALRARYPDLPIVGIEPALKPAAAQSLSGHIGVLATRATLSSDRFLRLRKQVESQSARTVHFWPHACDGLADAIERNRLDDIQALCQRHVSHLFAAGPAAQRIDTLVLGCTHYPFALAALQSAAAGHAVHFLDTGLPVAKRARDLLTSWISGAQNAASTPQPLLLSTGNATSLTLAAQRWIHPLLQAQTVAV